MRLGKRRTTCGKTVELKKKSLWLASYYYVGVIVTYFFDLAASISFTTNLKFYTRLIIDFYYTFIEDYELVVVMLHELLNTIHFEVIA